MSAAYEAPDDLAARIAQQEQVIRRWSVTGAELDRKEYPPAEWVVPGLIAEGYGLFTGAPKVGKSWVMLDLALAAATGGKAFGAIDVRQRPVLYLALEDGQRRLQDRARTLMGPGQRLPELLRLCTDRGAGVMSEFLPAYMARHGHEMPLVILDTLGAVMPPKTGGETEYQRDYRIGKEFKDYTARHPGSCFLVVHHVRKMTTGDWMESTSGTNGLNGAADFTVNLSADRGSDEGVLSVTGRDVVGGTYAVQRVKSAGGAWRLAGDGLTSAARQAEAVRAKQGLGDLSGKIVDVLAARGGRAGPKEIAEALGEDPAKVRVYLRRLVDGGRLRSPSHGVYELLDADGQASEPRGVTPVTLSEESAESCGTGEVTTGSNTVTTATSPEGQSNKVTGVTPPVTVTPPGGPSNKVTGVTPLGGVGVLQASTVGEVTVGEASQQVEAWWSSAEEPPDDDAPTAEDQDEAARLFGDDDTDAGEVPVDAVDAEAERDYLARDGEEVW